MPARQNAYPCLRDWRDAKLIIVALRVKNRLHLIDGMSIMHRHFVNNKETT
jgi:hypothetical protein